MMITVEQERRNTRNGVVSLYCKIPQSDSLEVSFVNVVEGGVRGVRIPQYRTWKRENTAIPHQNLAKYRNRSYKWEKVDVVNTKNPPFK